MIVNTTGNRFLPIDRQPLVISRDELRPYVDEIMRLRREFERPEHDAVGRLEKVVEMATAALEERIERLGDPGIEGMLARTLTDIVSNARR